MKQLIIALFALLSINASAQTLSDRVEETIVKPLGEYGILLTKSETSLYHNRKVLMFTIPLLKSPDATTNDSTTNAATGVVAEQLQKKYETLLQGLQQLRKSAYESYWWEKNDCDSLMISMSWNPRKDNRVTIGSNFKNMPKMSGADFIQVTKMNLDKSDDPHVPRCFVMFNFTQTTDTLLFTQC